ncbi:hypothetical protein PG999_012232 [Apiospora kogelbergensis]|uniref:Uncharacterized protein n=1 Tax=Apiospora kogelbergensis TaxID=1337665 RepID=A0AAW0QKU6_9PEZI
MADNQKPFKATHTFTHKYTREHILRKYLIDTAKLTTEQFRMQTKDNNLELEMADETVKLEEEQIKAIYQLFTEAEEKNKEDNACEKQEGQD